MKYLFYEYGQSLVSIVVSVMIVAIFVSLIIGDVLTINLKALEDKTNQPLMIEEKLPVSIDNFICKDSVIELNEKFAYQEQIEATNSKGEDISSFVTLYEDIDTSTIGQKEAIYILRYNGEKRIGKAKVFVIDEEYD